MHTLEKSSLLKTVIKISYNSKKYQSVVVLNEVLMYVAVRSALDLFDLTPKVEVTSPRASF